MGQGVSFVLCPFKLAVSFMSTAKLIPPSKESIMVPLSLTRNGERIAFVCKKGYTPLSYWLDEMGSIPCIHRGWLYIPTHHIVQGCCFEFEIAVILLFKSVWQVGLSLSISFFSFSSHTQLNERSSSRLCCSVSAWDSGREQRCIRLIPRECPPVLRAIWRVVLLK